MFSQRSAYQLTLTALISMASLSGCDSLWLPFTKEDSTSCVNKTPQCDNSSQTCNVDTGMCEPGSGTPLTFTDVSPKWLPMSGGSIVVRGSGFQYDGVSSRVSLDGIATAPVTITADSITATAQPVSQPVTQLCVPLRLDINRDDGKSLSIPNALVYRFEPYTISLLSKFSTFTDGIDQFYVGQLDKQNPKFDIVIKKAQGGFSVIPNESMSILNSPATPFIKVIPGYFSTTTDYAAIATISSTSDDSFQIFQYTETGIGISSINKTAKRYYKDILAIDLDPTRQDGDELLLLNSDPMNGAFLSAYKINIQTAGSPTVNGVLSLPFDAIAMAPFPSKASGPVDRLIVSETNSKLASQANIGFFQVIKSNNGFSSESFITNTLLPNDISAIATKDLDLDGLTDIVGYAPSTGNAYILVGTDSYGSVKILQGFSRSLRKPINVNLQIIDVNCDGRPDVFLSDLSGTESSIIHYNNPGSFSPDPANLLQISAGTQEKIPRVQALLPSSDGIIPNLLFMKSDGFYLGYPSFQKQ